MQPEGLVGHRALIGRASTTCARLVLIIATFVLILTTAPARGLAQDTPDIPLMIQTVPATSGLRFSLEGETFTSDGNGLALITVSQPGTYTLRVLDSSGKSGVRPEFHRWSDGSGSVRRSITIETFTRLEAGFEISHLTRFSFSTPDGAALSPNRIESIVLTGSDGSRHELSGAASQWLKSTTTVMQTEELKAQRISYRVTEAVVDGERVIQSQQDAFTPAKAGEWSIEISPRDGGEDASGREVEVVQPATTSEPSIDSLVAGLILAIAVLALLCLILVRRRPATRHAMAIAGPPVAIDGEMVAAGRASPEEARATMKQASPPDDGDTNPAAGATSSSPGGPSGPAGGSPERGSGPTDEPVAERSAPEKKSAPNGPGVGERSTPEKTAAPPKGSRSDERAVKERRPAAAARGKEARDKDSDKPASSPVEPPDDERKIDSYEQLGRKVSSILGSAYESADAVQREARNDARESLDGAVAEGAAVRDREHERSERAREKAQQKASELIDDAESYADQVREKTRRRVAELEEHLRRHQRLRAREQELRQILSQIEGMIPKLRSEMDGSEVREQNKEPFPSS